MTKKKKTSEAKIDQQRYPYKLKSKSIIAFPFKECVKMVLSPIITLSKVLKSWQKNNMQ